MIAVTLAAAIALALPAPVADISLCADYGNGVPPVCDQYELPEWDSPGQPDPVGECLYSWGWRGLPGDGRESLYAPRSVIELAVDRCTVTYV